MDSRAYAALTPGLETPDELDACTLLVNSQVSYDSQLAVVILLYSMHTCISLSHASLHPLKPLALPGMYASACK